MVSWSYLPACHAALAHTKQAGEGAALKHVPCRLWVSSRGPGWQTGCSPLGAGLWAEQQPWFKLKSASAEWVSCSVCLRALDGIRKLLPVSNRYFFCCLCVFHVLSPNSSPDKLQVFEWVVSFFFLFFFSFFFFFSNNMTRKWLGDLNVFLRITDSFELSFSRIFLLWVFVEGLLGIYQKPLSWGAGQNQRSETLRALRAKYGAVPGPKILFTSVYTATSVTNTESV